MTLTPEQRAEFVAFVRPGWIHWANSPTKADILSRVATIIGLPIGETETMLDADGGSIPNAEPPHS